MNQQYTENRVSAKASLTQQEGVLQGVTSLLQNVRTQILAAGASTLRDSSRQFIAEVLLSGWNARHTVFGCMNLAIGYRLFQVRRRQRAEDFQAILRKVHRQYLAGA